MTLSSYSDMSSALLKVSPEEEPQVPPVALGPGVGLGRRRCGGRRPKGVGARSHAAGRHGALPDLRQGVPGHAQEFSGEQ